MRHELLLCIYVCVLVAEIAVLLHAWKSTKIVTWVGLYIFEVSALAGALLLMHYYNVHPGYLLSTMGHVLWSMGAAVVFIIMLLLTVIMHILRTNRFK